MAEIIKVDGTRTKVKIPKKDSLEFLQKAVGGYIEVLPVHGQPKMKLVVDEEGNQKAKAFNPEASKLYGWSSIVGDVVLCDSKELR